MRAGWRLVGAAATTVAGAQLVAVQSGWGAIYVMAAWGLLYAAAAISMVLDVPRARAMVFGLGLSGLVAAGWMLFRLPQLEAEVRGWLAFREDWRFDYYAWMHRRMVLLGIASLPMVALAASSVKDRQGLLMAATTLAVGGLGVNALAWGPSPAFIILERCGLILAMIGVLGLLRGRGWALLVVGAAALCTLVAAVIDFVFSDYLHMSTFLAGLAGLILLAALLPVSIAVARGMSGRSRPYQAP